MNLFEYNEKMDDILSRSVNEDGEIVDETLIEELDALQMEFEEKVDNIILYIKSREAMSKALKEEKDALAARQKQAKNEADRLKKYLGAALKGKKHESVAGKVTYKKSKQVIIDDVGAIPSEYKRYKTVEEPDKTLIKDAIAEGKEVKGAYVIENINTQVK